MCKYVELGTETGRRPWVLHGRVVGCGADHEPLVTDIEVLEWVGPRAIEQAREHCDAFSTRGVLARMRRKDHARVRFGSLLRLRNVVGLLREQYDPSGGHGLGNLPHGHAHADLINAAHVLL